MSRIAALGATRVSHRRGAGAIPSARRVDEPVRGPTPPVHDSRTGGVGRGTARRASRGAGPKGPANLDAIRPGAPFSRGPAVPSHMPRGPAAEKEEAGPEPRLAFRRIDGRATRRR